MGLEYGWRYAQKRWAENLEDFEKDSVEVPPWCWELGVRPCSWRFEIGPCRQTIDFFAIGAENWVLSHWVEFSTIVWSRRAIRERVHTHNGAIGSWNSQRTTDFSQNSWTYIAFKLPRDPHAMLLFHCLWLRPHLTPCLPLVTVHANVLLIPHLLLLTPTYCVVSGNHFVDFIYGWMYLSVTSAGATTTLGHGDILAITPLILLTPGCICQ